MKKIYSLFLALGISLFLQGQQTEQCASMSVFHQQMQNPQTAASLQQAQSAARLWLAQHPNAGHERSAALITVPVVVHVVYITPAQNIFINVVKTRFCFATFFSVLDGIGN